MVRGRFLSALLLLAPVPQALVGQTSVDLNPKALADPAVVQVLAEGSLRELNAIDTSIAKDLALRLFSVAKEGSCVSETEWVCSYRYVLAVSEYGEMPSQNAYDLGEVGEIGAIHWVRTTHPDQAILTLEVRNYPLHAAKRNPELRLIRRRYQLTVTVDSVVVTPLQ
jgi:hypothetical protein